MGANIAVHNAIGKRAGDSVDEGEAVITAW